MIADMHCDTLYKIRKEKRNGRKIRLRDGEGLCINLEMMRQADYAVQNFAVYIDMKQETALSPYENAMELVYIFEEEMENNSELIRQVACFDDIELTRRAGKMAALLTLEEGGMCEGDMEKLVRLYERGARMMTLVWNYENELAYPAASGPDAAGLKKKGFEFLEMMENLGMIPDVSHLSDAGFRDVCAACRKPFVASHSNARSLCGHPRNLTDEMLRMLGERGGVAGLNFYPVFLSEEWNRENGFEILAKHACHMINKGGAACVGLGSDFDGFDGTGVPADAADAANLEWAFHRAGLSDDEIDGIMYRNVLNLYRETLK